MLPTITRLQRQAIKESRGKPVYVIDRNDLHPYVLLDSDDFDRLLAVVFEHATDLDAV